MLTREDSSCPQIYQITKGQVSDIVRCAEELSSHIISVLSYSPEL